MSALVELFGINYEVQTSQLSEFMWIAVGDYYGRRIEGKGRTKLGAIARWREQAQDLQQSKKPV
jgi:hypothetical protein